MIVFCIFCANRLILTERLKRILLDGQTSKWSQIKAGVTGFNSRTFIILSLYYDLPQGLF